MCDILLNWEQLQKCGGLRSQWIDVEADQGATALWTGMSYTNKLSKMTEVQNDETYRAYPTNPNVSLLEEQRGPPQRPGG